MSNQWAASITTVYLHTEVGMATIWQYGPGSKTLPHCATKWPHLAPCSQTHSLTQWSADTREFPFWHSSSQTPLSDSNVLSYSLLYTHTHAWLQKCSHCNKYSMFFQSQQLFSSELHVHANSTTTAQQKWEDIVSTTLCMRDVLKTSVWLSMHSPCNMKSRWCIPSYSIRGLRVVTHFNTNNTERSQSTQQCKHIAALVAKSKLHTASIQRSKSFSSMAIEDTHADAAEYIWLLNRRSAPALKQGAALQSKENTQQRHSRTQGTLCDKKLVLC